MTHHARTGYPDTIKARKLICQMWPNFVGKAWEQHWQEITQGIGLPLNGSDDQKFIEMLLLFSKWWTEDGHTTSQGLFPEFATDVFVELSGHLRTLGFTYRTPDDSHFLELLVAAGGDYLEMVKAEQRSQRPVEFP